MSLPVLEFTGNLTSDPELRFTPSGLSVVNLTVACNSKKKNDNGEWVDGETTFINLNAWGDFANNIAEKFNKGNRVGGKALWKQRSYEDKEGNKRTVYEGKITHLWEEVSQFPPRDGAPAPTAAPADPWNSAPVGVTEEEAPPF